jgi:uncharacterized membrane protein
MHATWILFFAFGIGVVAGLRTLTAPAAVAWAAHMGLLSLRASPLAFLGATWAAILFSILAVCELVGDILPQTPKRTASGPLAARLISGGLCGAALCTSANQSPLIGTALGAIGAVLSAFGGYELRKRLVARLNVKDFFIAIPEDLIAIVLALLIVTG